MILFPDYKVEKSLEYKSFVKKTFITTHKNA